MASARGSRQLGWWPPEPRQPPLMSQQRRATAEGTPLPHRQGLSVPATLSMHTTCPTAHGVPRRRKALQPKRNTRIQHVHSNIVKYHPNGYASGV